MSILSEPGLEPSCMHIVQSDRITYDEEVDDNLLFSLPVVRTYVSDSVEVVDVGEMWRGQFSDDQYESFDQWGRLLSRSLEITFFHSLVKKGKGSHSSGLQLPTSDMKQKSVDRIHLRNISCAEIVEQLRDIYEEL